MKQFIKAAVPVLSIVLLAACGNTGGKQQDTGHDHTKMDEAAAAPATVTLKDGKLNAIYQHYVHLTTALTKGDEAEAKIAANAIEAGASEAPGAEKIGQQAAQITAAAGIDAQRTAYATLSQEFIALVKKSGLNSGQLYVDFCPMAMNDKGAYWLSATEEISNPYFGDEMKTCGEVKDTIK
jgi:major membrane immunogen (membrane-anchored lipoprotein)